MKLSTLVLCLCVVVANAAAVPAAAASKEPTVPPLVAKLCKESPDPTTCKNALGGDPGSKNADLPRLSLIAIRLTTFTALSSAGIISKNLENKNLGAKEAECYKNCTDLYTAAVEGLDGSLVELVHKRYNQAKLKIIMAGHSVDKCEMCFIEIKHKNAMISVETEKVRLMGMNANLVVDALQSEAGAGAKH